MILQAAILAVAVFLQTLAAGALRAEVEFGLCAAAKTPLSATDPRTIAEVLEYAVSQPNFDRLTFSVKNLIEGIQTLPRLRRLVEVEEAGKLPFEKTAKLADALGDDATAKALAQWTKVSENLLPLQAGDLDRVEDFIRLFQLDTPEGKAWLRETMEALDGKTASEILADGIKVSSKIKDVFPQLFHYTDADNLIRRAIPQPDGTWVLRARDDGGFRYLTPDNFSAQADAQSFLQLPKASSPEAALGKARFKCVITTDDIASDISIPVRKDMAMGVISRHSSGFNPWSGTIQSEG